MKIKDPGMLHWGITRAPVNLNKGGGGFRPENFKNMIPR